MTPTVSIDVAVGVATAIARDPHRPWSPPVMRSWRMLHDLFLVNRRERCARPCDRRDGRTVLAGDCIATPTSALRRRIRSKPRNPPTPSPRATGTKRTTSSTPTTRRRWRRRQRRLRLPPPNQPHAGRSPAHPRRHRAVRASRRGRTDAAVSASWKSRRSRTATSTSTTQPSNPTAPSASERQAPRSGTSSKWTAAPNGAHNSEAKIRGYERGYESWPEPTFPKVVFVVHDDLRRAFIATMTARTSHPELFDVVLFENAIAALASRAMSHAEPSDAEVDALTTRACGSPPVDAHTSYRKLAQALLAAADANVQRRKDDSTFPRDNHTKY